MLNEVLSRVEERLQAVGLSAAAASAKAGLSKDAIRNMQRAISKKGRAGVSTKTINALAPVLGVSAGWLLDGEGDPVPPLHVPVVTDVPLLSWVSAGELEHHDSQVAIDDAPKVAAIDLPEGDYIALRVSGPSMNKISPPESIIFVNRKDTRLVSNACYVIADETGEATYKRYRPKEKPQFQPVTFEEGVTAPELRGTIRVIGRVRRTVLDL